jgi:hypothetical protein
MIKGANDLYNKFFKEDPFLLSAPFKNPNGAMDDPSKAYDALEPFIKISGAYEYLNAYAPAGRASKEPLKARRDLLNNMLWYITSKDERLEQERKQFGWTRWNDNLKSAAADDMVKIGKITKDDYNEILRRRDYNILFAMLQNGYREGGEGLGKFFLNLLKIIRYE